MKLQTEMNLQHEQWGVATHKHAHGHIYTHTHGDAHKHLKTFYLLRHLKS